VDVALIRWPVETERRARLATVGLPRLLLVEGDAFPPCPDDCLEDWIRVPAPEPDVEVRKAALALRASEHVAVLPELDPDGVLRLGTKWAPLPPVEARLTRPLVDRFGSVVTRDLLTRSGWPSGAPGRNALDVHVLRLRRRVASVGLAIRTVRSRGYLLELAGEG
jgi:two-component system, OmpR family, response regulator